ncbi:hypothetical protein D1007_34445 [Hordeum vulgare]|nr:hypothetical protein D1007_34445 [Hordeum vulgare]
MASIWRRGVAAGRFRRPSDIFPCSPTVALPSPLRLFDLQVLGPSDSGSAPPPPCSCSARPLHHRGCSQASVQLQLSFSSVLCAYKVFDECKKADGGPLIYEAICGGGSRDFVY